MVNDVVKELERYGNYAESVAPPLDVAEVATRNHVTDSRSLVSRRFSTVTPRRGLAFAAGTALVTILLIGSIALIDPFVSEQPPSGVIQVSPTTAPTDSTELLPTIVPVQVEPIVWNLNVSPDLDIEGAVEGLAVADSGLYAAGSALGLDGAETAAAWFSDDGVEWVRFEDDVFANSQSPFGEDSFSVARAVADHSGRVVVAGVDSHVETGATVAAIWYSKEGEAWTRVLHDDGLFGTEDVEINTLIAPFNAGYVAAGTHVWVSPNGIDWERSELREGTAYAVTEYDSGLLAGGERESTGQAMIWLSRDIGSTWTPVEVETRPDLFNRSVINSITLTDNGFVAVGGVGTNNVLQPAAWTSTDGQAWNLVWASGAEASGAFKSVAHSAGQTVAVGQDPTVGPGGIVWMSGDGGNSWVEYDDRLGLFAPGTELGTGSVSAILSNGGGGFIAAGQRTDSPTVWLGTTPDKPPEVDSDGRPLVGWTCQARIDNGAVWSLGNWKETVNSYTTTEPPACLDLLDIHYEPQQWKVEWEGSAKTLEVGLMFVFERGIHGTIYADKEVSTESGEWVTPVLAPDADQPFTFVVMPHSFDDWESITFTVTPCSASTCG